MIGNVIIHKGHEILPFDTGYIIRGKYITKSADLRQSSKLVNLSEPQACKVTKKLAINAIDRAISYFDSRFE
tara:strand:- start:42 stop:257 length:216 start_codon:yes stop_codon:yes gene_type:complete